jgi:hypothetical protein
MWVWSDAPPADVVPWAAEHGVSQLFVHVPATGPDAAGLARLTELKSLAAPAGIALAALGGAPEWATDHATALAWQQAVDGTGVFTSYHVDVEPYLLPEWTTARTQTAKAYLSMLDKLRAAALPLEADVPFWYGEIPVGKKNLATEVLARVSAVTVMSYRDRGTGTNSMWSISQDWLSRGATAGKRVRLAAETGPSLDCSYCTFAEEGATALGTALAEVDAAARSAPAFGGIAIHHYDAWRVLPA